VDIRIKPGQPLAYLPRAWKAVADCLRWNFLSALHFRLGSIAFDFARDAPKTFARTTRKRMRTESGGYRRDHLRALAHRIKVDQKELRIMGSKSAVPRTLVAAESAKAGGFGVPSSVPNWRARRDSNFSNKILKYQRIYL
jgi:hypothetical protein